MSIASACAAEYERRIDSAERDEENYQWAKRDYLRELDFQDIADNCPDEIPELLKLVKAGQLAAAQYALEKMIDKSADSYADIVAARMAGDW